MTWLMTDGLDGAEGLFGAWVMIAVARWVLMM